MATQTVEQKIDALQKQMATVEQIAGEISKADPLGNGARVHVTDDPEGAMRVGYWNADTAKAVGPGNAWAHDARYKRALPPGYKGAASEGTFKNFGEWLQEGHRNKHNLAEWHSKNVKTLKAIQGMSEGSATDGGYLVLPEYNTEIFSQVYSNDLWARTNQFTVTGNSMTFNRDSETSRVNGSRHGGIRGYWVGEGATLTKSKPGLKETSLKLNKLAVLVYLTQELVDDAPALQAYVSRVAAEEFNFLLGDALINGTGAGQPLGIIDSGQTLSITKETGQPATTIVTENIDKMWARRRDGGNYIWLHNKDCGPQLDRLEQSVGTGGVTLYRPENGLAGAMPQLLKTAPRIETEFNATLGTVGDIILADMGAFVSITKGGITQAASIHVEFLTDQMVLRFTLRADARPLNESALTPFKGTNTQSSFLTVATRS